MDLSRKIKEVLKFKHVKADISSRLDDRDKKIAVYQDAYNLEMDKINIEKLEELKTKAVEDARKKHTKKGGSFNWKGIWCQLKLWGKEADALIWPSVKKGIEEKQKDSEDDDEFDELVEEYLREELRKDKKTHKKHNRHRGKSINTEENKKKDDDNDIFGVNEDIFGDDDMNMFG